MNTEFNGIERRLNELSERLNRLEPLIDRPQADFEKDTYLQDIVERNLEVVIQCCIDVCHRLIAMDRTRQPTDYYDAIMIVREIGVVPLDFVRHLAPLAGFRNILVHEYVNLDWDRVYRYLQNLGDLRQFLDYVRSWLRMK